MMTFKLSKKYYTIDSIRGYQYILEDYDDEYYLCTLTEL